MDRREFMSEINGMLKLVRTEYGLTQEKMAKRDVALLDGRKRWHLFPYFLKAGFFRTSTGESCRIWWRLWLLKT